MSLVVGDSQKRVRIFSAFRDLTGVHYGNSCSARHTSARDRERKRERLSPAKILASKPRLADPAHQSAGIEDEESESRA